MKMQMTYEEANLRRLIRNDLARRGIPVSDEDITFPAGKGKAITATVSVTIDDDAPAEIVEPVPAPQPHTVEHAAPTPRVPPLPDEKVHKTPALEVVEGGNNPTDFSDVVRASNKMAANKPGMFPTPTRELMDGESHEFPGGKR